MVISHRYREKKYIKSSVAEIKPKQLNHPINEINMRIAFQSNSHIYFPLLVFFRELFAILATEQI